MKLKVEIGELKLDTPVVCASGTFGFGEELRGLVDFKYIGAVTTKTVTPNPRAGNPPPRIYETACGVINSVGLENPGLEVFLKEKLPLISRLKTKKIISVGGFSAGDYCEMVEKLSAREEVTAIEVNFSCPNLRMKKLVSQSEKLTYQLTKNLRSLTKKILIIKITPEVTDIVKIAKAAERGGADAISLVNTFFSLAINSQTQQPYLGSGYGGYSGRAIKPMALYRVWKVAGNTGIPIIGGGGIEDAGDAVEFILAGATAVSLGTINLTYPNQAKKIVEGIQEYMKRKNIHDINELRGKLIWN